MDHGEIEGEVVDFILEDIESVPHLEALLLIWQSRPGAWTYDALAARIYVPVQKARAILEDLSRRGFVRRRDDVPTYVANEEWPGSRDVLPRLAEAYRKQLVRITTLIHSKAAASVREFARAFQIKKDK